MIMRRTEPTGYLFLSNRHGKVHVTWSQGLGREGYRLALEELHGGEDNPDLLYHTFGIPGIENLQKEMQAVHGIPFEGSLEGAAGDLISRVEALQVQQVLGLKPKEAQR